MHKCFQLFLSRRKEENKYSPTSSLATVSVDTPEQIDSDDRKIQSTISDVLRIHSELSQKTDLRPRDEVNRLFGELVELCTQRIPESIANKIMNSAPILTVLPSLHKISATAEGHLESHWASQITGSENSPDTPETVHTHLQQFPYYENYISLTRLELSALTSIPLSPSPSPISKIAFIGSGPLPLTSLTLLSTLPRTPSLEILNIDHSPRAIHLSRLLCRALGARADGMAFLCSSATSPSLDLTAYDVVYLAALVGCSQVEKEGVLVSVVSRMRDGGILVVRSSHGLRGVLYPGFDASSEAVREVLEVEVEVRPFGRVVNSVVVGRVRGRVEKE